MTTSGGGWSLSSLFSWGSSSGGGAGGSHRGGSGRRQYSGRGHGGGSHHSFFFGPATGSGSPGKSARKILCRYGMGCTHVTDPVHQERFWHPPIPSELGIGGSVGTGSPRKAPLPPPPSAQQLQQDAEDEAMDAAASALFPCHECGLPFRRLAALRLHLQRKTAWSNASLVGCRLSCLVDNREWQEGLVLEYSPATGRHRVSFEHVGQVRSMVMAGAAFFIIRRPPPSPRAVQGRRALLEEGGSSSSSRRRWRRRRSRRRAEARRRGVDGDDEDDDEGEEGDDESKRPAAGDYEEEEDGDDEDEEGEGEEMWVLEEVDRAMEPVLAPLEPWDYAEPLSLGYARAQSRVHQAYGWRIQETGHKTLGHLCVTESDKELARDAQSSLLYGELLPRGINKALLPGRLSGGEARVVYELGMGIGKVAMQVFCQYPRTIRRVLGVELSQARYAQAEAAARRLCQAHPAEYELAEAACDWGRRVVVRRRATGAVLEMRVGNLLAVEGIGTADVVLLETDLAPTIYPALCALLRGMKAGARAFTYLDLRKIWGQPDPEPGAEAEAGGEEGKGAGHYRAQGSFPFRQLDVNRPITDRYATSWSVNRGHHFFLWAKVLAAGSDEKGPAPSGWADPERTWAPDAPLPQAAPVSMAAAAAAAGGGGKAAVTAAPAVASAAAVEQYRHRHHHGHAGARPHNPHSQQLLQPQQLQHRRRITASASSSSSSSSPYRRARAGTAAAAAGGGSSGSNGGLFSGLSKAFRRVFRPSPTSSPAGSPAKGTTASTAAAAAAAVAPRARHLAQEEDYPTAAAGATGGTGPQAYPPAPLP